MLTNSNVNGNTDNGVSILDDLNRRLVISSSHIGRNGENGISIGKNYGQVELMNVVVEDNLQSGLSSASDYGEITIDQSLFDRNGVHGVAITLYTVEYHTQHMSMVNSSASYNADGGVIYTKSNSFRSSCWRWRLFITNCTFIGNVQQGLRLGTTRFCDDELNVSAITNNTFTKNQGSALVLFGTIAIEVRNNQFLNNFGVDTIFWTLPYRSARSEVNFKNNMFLNNFGQEILRLLPFDDSSLAVVLTEITGNIFENNTCFSVLSIDLRRFANDDTESEVCISRNIFINNIPRPFLPHLAHIIPISTIATNQPRISITNNIFENDLFPFDLAIVGNSHGVNINATRNFWSTNHEIQIQERIYDFFDNFRLSSVNYFPFLNSNDIKNVVPQDTPRISLAFQRNNTIGGVVIGEETLLNTGTDYFVDREIIVPIGGKLIIEPGVNIYFPSYTSVFVQGQVIAIGDPSNVITLALQNNVASDGAIRLTNGNVPWEGILEVQINDTWLSVCDNFWTDADARIACRQLGYYDFVSHNRYYNNDIVYRPLFDHSYDCSGTETSLQECPIRESLCYYYYTIALRCHGPQWGGLFFPFDSRVSILKHVDIIEAGNHIRWYSEDSQQLTDRVSKGAVEVHMDRHVFENVRIQSPAFIGLEVFYNDPFSGKYSQTIFVTVQDCSSEFVVSDRHRNNQYNYDDGMGVEFHSLAGRILLDNFVSNCYTGFKSDDISFQNHRDYILKYVNSDRLKEVCNINITLEKDDYIILASSSDNQELLCTATITTLPGDLVGVFVLYTGSSSTITVQESGNTTLFVDSRQEYYDFANSAISMDSSVSIIVSTRYHGHEDYLILVQAIPGKYKKVMFTNNNSSNHTYCTQWYFTVFKLVEVYISSI